MEVSSTSQPIFLSKTLVQGSTLWIDSIWQWIPRIRSATFWSESRISQNTRLSRNRVLIYMQWAYHQDLTSHSDEDLITTWGWLREERQYTPQCDKGLWGLTTSMSLMQVPVNLENDPDEPLSPFSPMTAPRLWSKLFLAIRGGCQFLFLSSTTVTSSELLFGRLVQLLSFFLWQWPYALSCFSHVLGNWHTFFLSTRLMLWAAFRPSWAVIELFQ